MKKIIVSLLLLLSSSLLQAQTSYNTGCATAPANSPGVCAQIISIGGSVTLFNGTQPTTGAHSPQFYVQPTPLQPSPNISFEFSFASNPGTFNYQIEDSTTDLTGNYVTIPVAGTITSCPQSEGGAYVCRVELNPFMGRYGRVYVQTQTQNAVNVTVTVTR